MYTLIVDDDPSVRQLLREIMTGLSELFAECGNGLEAVRKCEEQAPDLVIMDVSMPEMDGIEATRLIHARDPRIPVIIVTQYESAEYARHAVAAGAMAFFKKENLSTLRRYIRDWKRDRAIS